MLAFDSPLIRNLAHSAFHQSPFRGRDLCKEHPDVFLTTWMGELICPRCGHRPLEVIPDGPCPICGKKSPNPMPCALKDFLDTRYPALADDFVLG